MGRIYGTTGTKTGGRIYGKATSGIENLEELALAAGYKPPKPKGPGVLEKLFSVLSAAETAPSVYAGLTGKDPLKTYGKEFAKGISGRGVYEKKTYADVLKLMGMPEGKIAGPISARGLLGLAGDIFLDPTTYFG